MLITRVELEGDQRTLVVDDTCCARYIVAKRCGSKMLNINMYTNRAFSGFEKRQDCVSCSMFEEPDEPWCTKNGGHLFIDKVDHVLIGNDERQFSLASNLQTILHVISFDRMPTRNFCWQTGSICDNR